MPTKPRKACAHFGCPRLAAGRYCEVHTKTDAPKAWAKTTTSAHARGYGARWRKLRALVLDRDPVCMVCGRRPSVTADHVVNKARGGSDSMDNLQGICSPCHKAKTSGESR